ncbi:uncharacterized protein SOCE26_100230 [Sorangium cellulosum]|uniref:Uncharacterized protein n=1 Tax=Sorangium cellulosum TaxID=56 RepID=A0A2L0FA78_SORCE|nr:dienelactone hydrolase family protein [Sorangium cellulosum]AUX48485.1 uncharacterized protein SOCE26_100230 [Sorangium cellulosum]
MMYEKRSSVHCITAPASRWRHIARSSAARLAARAGQVSCLTAVALSASCGAVDGAEDDLELIDETSAAVLVATSLPCSTISTGSIGYLEHLPSDYATTGDQRYPTMIFLHGRDERGSNLDDLERLKTHGPPKHIKNGHTMTFTVDGKTEKFIVIAPQLSPTFGLTYPQAWLTCVIDHTLANYRADPDRLYVTGLSMGGYGTYAAATSATLAPKIAAVAPIAGGGTVSKACVIADNHIPVWAFHGDADTVVPLATGQAMINAINNCEPPPDPPPIFTIYPGVGHNSWDRAYNTGHTYHNPNLYEWLLRQRRDGASVKLTPVSVTKESGLGDAGMLIDEQGIAGDPRDGTAGQPVQGWASGYASDMPANAYIDLGEEVDLTDVYLFDANGNNTTRNDEWVVSVGAPGSWTVVATEPSDRYLVWKRHTVSARTRYVRISNRVAFIGMNEVVLYGRR